MRSRLLRILLPLQHFIIIIICLSRYDDLSLPYFSRFDEITVGYFSRFDDFLCCKDTKKNALSYSPKSSFS